MMLRLHIHSDNDSLRGEDVINKDLRQQEEYYQSWRLFRLILLKPIRQFSILLERWKIRFIIENVL